MNCLRAQSSGAIEYTDCISAELSFPNEYPAYDTKQSDGEVLVFEISGMRNLRQLLFLPGPLWPWVVAPDMVLSMGQIELFGI